VNRTGARRERVAGQFGRLAGLELIVFDKDGTLIDFDAMWGPWLTEFARRLQSLAGAAAGPELYRAFGFDPAAGHVLSGGALAGTPMGRLRELAVSVLAAAGSPAAAEEAVGRAWEPPDPVALARPLADLPALFAALRERGLRICVATTDDRAPTERTLAALGIAPLVDALVCADDGLPVKPAPDMIRHLCRALDVDHSRCAVVGDSPADLAMGRAAGAGLVVGVLSGVGSRADLEPLADLVVASIADLHPG
jgi:phosphoglycolate phosphatase-like HAD superfamily hydrolase